MYKYYLKRLSYQQLSEDCTHCNELQINHIAPICDECKDKALKLEAKVNSILESFKATDEDDVKDWALEEMESHDRIEGMYESSLSQMAER